MNMGTNLAEYTWRRCQRDWLDLEAEEQAQEILSQGEIYRRYCLSEKYGQQTYNILSKGGQVAPFPEKQMISKTVEFKILDPKNQTIHTITKTFTYDNEQSISNAITETMRKGGLSGYKILETPNEES